MLCPRCNTAMEDGALFCGNCGAQVASQSGGSATIADNTPTVHISPAMRQERSGWPKASDQTISADWLNALPLNHPPGSPCHKSRAHQRPRSPDLLRRPLLATSPLAYCLACGHRRGVSRGRSDRCFVGFQKSSFHHWRRGNGSVKSHYWLDR